MKKNFLFYILITIITLFSFNLNVNAAQELTCVYEKSQYDNKIILVQTSIGGILIYEHTDANATIASEGWLLKEGWGAQISQVSTVDEDNHLTACPKVLYNEKVPSPAGIVKHFGDEIINKKDIESTTLEDSYNEVKKLVEGSGEVVGNNNKFEWQNKVEKPYTGMCIYESNIEYYEFGNVNEKFIGKHRIQINYSSEKFDIAEYDPQKGKDYSGIEYISVTADDMYEFKFSPDKNFNLEYFLGTNDGACPRFIIVDRMFASRAVTTTIYTNDKKYTVYYLADAKGYNPTKPNENLTTTGINASSIKPKSKIENCTELLGEDIAGYLKLAWNILKIGIPIILLGLGTIDFTQAIFAGKEDDMKKAQGRFVKRIIIAIIIFLVPSVLSLLLKIANDIWGNFGTDICGILF